jgi:hypothetical protein
MLRTVEATIDKDGRVRLTEPVRLDGTKRALVTILEDGRSENDAAILAESALAEAWAGADEDEAWKHLADLPDLDEGKE